MIRNTIQVARLEMDKRLHSTRWVVALISWVVALLLVTTALYLEVAPVFGVYADTFHPGLSASGASVLMLFVCAITITIAASSAAGTVNGDRENGMLALMQVTPVSGWSIIFGKVLAAWLNSLAFLLLSLPFIFALIHAQPDLWPGFGLGALVVAVELLAFAGIGVGWSVLTPRPAGSSALAVFTVLAVFLGSPVLLLTLENFTAERFTVEHTELVFLDYDRETGQMLEPGDPGYGQSCEIESVYVNLSHTNRYWWLLLTNPVVAVGDALPDSGRYERLLAQPADIRGPRGEGLVEYENGVARAVTSGLAYLRLAPAHEKIVNECGPEKGKVVMAQVGDPEAPVDDRSGIYFGWVLVIHVVAGAAMVALAGASTKVPVVKLARGTRIA
ncbi:MAG: ABC transporter permease [Actinomycetaceae bacterium]|nr:ABC transporter permease [Actinomycetaceae bacterium]